MEYRLKGHFAVVCGGYSSLMNGEVARFYSAGHSAAERRDGRTALVTPSPTSMFNLAAFASPDGTKIVFECRPAFASPIQICEIISNGTGFKYLTDTPGRS